MARSILLGDLFDAARVLEDGLGLGGTALGIGAELLPEAPEPEPDPNYAPEPMPVEEAVTPPWFEDGPGDEVTDRFEWPEPTCPRPLDDEINSYLLADDGKSTATDGCVVEPDGICEHGHPSWPLYMSTGGDPQ